ncbi:uncharacterized protein PHACADRAFT_201977 [Phanerochaete carnosa HHB-10118-sp]|uniref:Uncharacterized protein n=1 Tax=Phanerochaete carnosa (strain HHB-10118-sp) TaxID=650164 RepID=K5UHY3_PHACS|nr:uncharacterized protein PHACADRAFT_201977 [Phanerochaete carnosa HHB-10118-sp]EKM49136.1 hypothetical protein PHACADRAFT_201977 [Phanerochaete carnosa HHB-10118-sp]
MVPATSSTTLQVDYQTEGRNFSWARGRAHANTDSGTHVVVALNKLWVPQLVVGRVDIILRPDGRFGIEDPLNWPQLYSESKPYLALIPKAPRATSDAAPLWQTPASKDFIRANDDASGGAFGYLSRVRLVALGKIVDKLDGEVQAFKRSSSAAQPAVIDDLRRLQAAMHNAMTMFGIPSTYRDVVRRCGRLLRCWAECWAFLRWHGVVLRCAEVTVANDDSLIPLEPGVDDSGVMGAVCSDPGIARKLFVAGVPVWLLQRSHTVGTPQIEGRPAIQFTRPEGVETTQTVAMGGVRCTEQAGEPHLIAISRESEAVLDIEDVPLPAAFGLTQYEDEPGPSSGRTTGRTQAPQRVRATARFVPEAHDLLPRRMGAWGGSLEALDMTKLCESRVGLWLPEPELLITPTSLLRLMVYVSNWITIRLAIFSKLGRRTLYETLTPNYWRLILERFPEMTEEEKKAWEQKKLMGRNSSGKAGPPTTPRGRGSDATALSGSRARRHNDRNATPGPSSQARREPAKERSNERQSVCDYFTAFLDFEHHPFTLRTAAIRSFAWRGWKVPLICPAEGADTLPLPADVAREVAWELGEVAFRVELRELDRRMAPQDCATDVRRSTELLSQIFPGTHWSRPDLPPPQEGLSASNIRDRCTSLEGLRQLLVRWDGCPATFREQRLDTGAPQKALEDFEHAATVFYCETAYKKFGRAAAVPREVPQSFYRDLDLERITL